MRKEDGKITTIQTLHFRQKKQTAIKATFLILPQQEKPSVTKAFL
jgi:hypothetical protein